MHCFGTVKPVKPATMRCIGFTTDDVPAGFAHILAMAMTSLSQPVQPVRDVQVQQYQLEPHKAVAEVSKIGNL